MKEVGFPGTVTLRRTGESIPLQKFLDKMACAIRLPDGSMAELSKKDLILLWSQQHGAAHEDWALDARLATIFKTPLFVNGHKVEAVEILNVSRTVWNVSADFLEYVTLNPPSNLDS